MSRPSVVMALALILSSACGRMPAVPPDGLPELFASTEASPAAYEQTPDRCIRVHHVWKAEARAVHRSATSPGLDRVQLLVDSAYTPWASFWDDYLGSDFARWSDRDRVYGLTVTFFTPAVD